MWNKSWEVWIRQKRLQNFEDCTVLVLAGAKTSLASLKTLLSCLSQSRSKYCLFGGIDNTSRQFADRLQENGLRFLCRLLIEHFENLIVSPAKARNIKLLISSLFYMYETSWPRTSIGMDSDRIVANCGRIRFLQWAVAASKFYGLSEGRSDSVLVTKLSKKKRQKRKRGHVLASGLVKNLCFVRKCDETILEISWQNHAYQSYPFRNHQINNELCFFNVMGFLGLKMFRLAQSKGAWAVYA